MLYVGTNAVAPNNVINGGGQQINNQNKTVTPTTNGQTVTADQGYTGLGTVTINPIQYTSRTINPSTSSQTFYAISEKLYTGFDKIGNPTVTNDGIATKLNPYDYLRIPQAFMPGDNTWELILKIKTPPYWNTLSYLMGSVGSYYYTIGGELSSNNHFGFGITSNGSSWDISWMVSQNTAVPNTWYWVKLSFDGTQYKLELSTDGENYTLESVVVNSTPIYQNQYQSFLNLGTQANGYSYWKGDIDLNECQIKINDQIWWKPSYITVGDGSLGYSHVTVNPVTANIDSNITSQNIVDGVTILGVTGSYQGVNPTGTTYISSNGNYDVTNYAEAEVNVPQPQLMDFFGITLGANTTLPYVADFTTYPQYAGTTSATFYAPENFVASNIKNGVKIMGVTGTYTGGPEIPTYGSRLQNKATAVGILSDQNNNQYVLAVVDAAYRSDTGYTWGPRDEDSSIDDYAANDYDGIVADTCSGEYNTHLMETDHNLTYAPAFEFARNACTLSLNDKVYHSCLPTIRELEMIRAVKEDLDTYDPTLTSYPDRSLTLFTCGGTNGVWASNEINTTGAWADSANGIYGLFGRDKSSPWGVIPVFCIPVSDFDSNRCDEITAVNKTGSVINTGDKVWIEPTTSGGTTTYAIKDFSNITSSCFTGIAKENISAGTESSTMTVTGSLTDNNGILSGFSASNYGILDNLGAPASFEILTKIKMDETGYYGSVLDNTFHFVRIGDGKIGIYNSIDGSIANFNVVTDKWYWCKGVFDGTSYTLYCLQDLYDYDESDLPPLSSWNVAATTTNVSGLNLNSVYFGTDSGYLPNYFHGSVNIKQTKITSGGSVIWKNKNVTGGGSGSVKTVLPSV